jgi:hypothetical protein
MKAPRVEVKPTDRTHATVAPVPAAGNKEIDSVVGGRVAGAALSGVA